MPSTREFVYLNLDKKQHMVTSYGIEFNEFISSLNNKTENILVLEGDYLGSRFDFTINGQYYNTVVMGRIR